MNNTLSKIQLGKRPKVLLLGNGINRAFTNYEWGNLLDKISCDSIEEEILEQLPFPLRAVLLSGDNVDEGVKELSEELTNLQVTSEQAGILNDFIDLSFDAVLTTNYSYEIEKTIDETFRCTVGKKSSNRKYTRNTSETENQFGLYRYMQLDKCNVWHIHGEAAKPKSMILGHYYYGKLIYKIEEYIPKFIRRYKGIIKAKGEYLPLSWIDYFLLGDVYIVGLGLDPSEMDLWWLINCKKRRTKDFGGKIYWYEPNLDSKSSFAKKKLAETNGVFYRTEKVTKKQYKDYYRNLSSIIRTDM